MRRRRRRRTERGGELFTLGHISQKNSLREEMNDFFALINILRLKKDLFAQLIARFLRF
jgi:hypothetical protein